MTTLSLAGYSIGGLDSITSVKDAADQLKTNPNDPKLIATYDGALVSAAATFIAGIPGVGAAFAENAIIANITNLTLNQSTMSKTNVLGTATAIAGEVITLAGWRGSFLGLAEMKLSPNVGGAMFNAAGHEAERATTRARLRMEVFIKTCSRSALDRRYGTASRNH